MNPDVIIEQFNNWYNDRRIKQKINSFNPKDIGDAGIEDFILWLEWTKDGHNAIKKIDSNKEITEIVLWLCTDCGQSFCGPGISKPIPCQSGCHGLTMIPVKVCTKCELPMDRYDDSSIDTNGVVYDVIVFHECPNCGKRK